jgi:hypothetical protein
MFTFRRDVVTSKYLNLIIDCSRPMLRPVAGRGIGVLGLSQISPTGGEPPVQNISMWMDEALFQ